MKKIVKTYHYNIVKDNKIVNGNYPSKYNNYLDDCIIHDNMELITDDYFFKFECIKSWTGVKAEVFDITILDKNTYDMLNELGFRNYLKGDQWTKENIKKFKDVDDPYKYKK